LYRKDTDLGTALRIPIAGGPPPYSYPLPGPLSDRDAAAPPPRGPEPRRCRGRLRFPTRGGYDGEWMQRTEIHYVNGETARKITPSAPRGRPWGRSRRNEIVSIFCGGSEDKMPSSATVFMLSLTRQRLRASCLDSCLTCPFR